MTQTVNVTQARQEFSQLLDRVYRKEARVVVEKSGIPVAAIISAQDLKRFTELEAWREERFKALDATRAAFKEVPDEELEREVNRAFQEARQRARAQKEQAAKAP